MKQRPKAQSFRSLILTAITAAVCCGCSGDSYKYVQVAGELKYEDGSIIHGESVSLIFKPQVEPVNKETPPNDGYASVSTRDGSFTEATTEGVKNGEIQNGIVAGTHHVVVIATGPDGKSVVPVEYTKEDSTPLKITTDDNQPFSFRVPKRE